MYNPTETCDDPSIDLIKSQTFIIESLNKRVARFVTKINTVKEYIVESYQETGELHDHLSEIAEILGIELTKPIVGKATFTISWRAEVPIDFDPEDIQFSFGVTCDSDVEDFDWEEIDTNISGGEY
jgi:hypothetical protein